MKEKPGASGQLFINLSIDLKKWMWPSDLANLSGHNNVYVILFKNHDNILWICIGYAIDLVSRKFLVSSYPRHLEHCFNSFGGTEEFV